jgi:segregation and condensation protein A
VIAFQSSDYAVRLDTFEGPLDLLLRLIERAELDITTISLARVTDQYLAYMRQLQEIHPDLLADFLVVAAKLILIKSRALLPRPPVVEEEEEDVGQDLVRQMEEYRRFKEASLCLQRREEQGLRSYVRVASPPLKPRGLAPGEVTLSELLAALERVLAVAPTEPVSSIVPPLAVSIDDKIRAVESMIAANGRVHFTGLLHRAGSRAEIIVTFLAILELIKRGRLLVEQAEAFGEIYLSQAPAGRSGSVDDPPAGHHA